MSLTLKIFRDECPESPDAYDDDVLFLAASVRDSIETGMKRRAELLLTKARTKAKFHIFPVWGYKHSGFAMSLTRGYPFNCPWDSGMAGEVFASKKEWPDLEAAYKAAESLIESWNQYLSGDVWVYVVKDEEGEVVESCGGFYGREHAESDGALALQSCLEDREQQEAKIDLIWAS